MLGSGGEYAWGGAASTIFWCDPREQIAVVFMTALIFGADYVFAKGVLFLYD